MKYYYVIHTPVEIFRFPADVFAAENARFEEGGFTLEAGVTRKNGYNVFELTVSAKDEREVYLSLCGEGEGDFYSFEGGCREERIFRQSPHDVGNFHFKMEKSAIPMVAAVCGVEAEIFVSDNPSFFDNATTQHINPVSGSFLLSSGDPGGAPNCPESEPFAPIFHKICARGAHTFRFIALRAKCGTLKGIRREVYRAIEAVWGENSPSLYRATCFAGNYMHMRKNEKGTSEKWIVAGIQYANTQYFRDAFYQTLIMDAETEAQCYGALTKEWAKNAENPLLCLIWSYRLLKNGKKYNRALADDAFATLTECMDKYGGGGFYPNCREHGDFRNWFDICAYELDDVDAYTQGLCVCALECAKKLGYDIGERKEQALARYVSLFNGEYIPMSEKKQYLAVDISVGEVLYFYLFGKTFIPDEMFRATYRRICDGASRTPYGIKAVSAPDGSYLPVEAYGLNGYIHPGFATIETGRYANGGSYHVYEMLFHIAAHLHGIEDAEANLTARLMTDLDFDGATHEYMHTVRGNGVKAGQGWNAGIYAIWEDVMKKGRAGGAFFAAADKKLEEL
ncbi:MAG: hypothetical protein IJW21_04190 [Clostridia bacterium]|nr:hypothetical protein [Clostridia bacterium]